MRTIWAENEFKYDGPTLLNGTCGENALAMAESYVWQKYVPTLAVYHAMRANGWCGVNGASNATEVYDQAVKDGANAELRAYGEPWSDWYSWIIPRLQNKCAVVINLANGQALVDALSGKGENAHGLQYHFIAGLEYHPGGYNARLGQALPEGVVCVDGDNFSTPYSVVTNQAVFYPISTLSAARPCGAIALKYQGGTPMGAPAGWNLANGVLTAPNGGQVVRGFLDFVMSYPGGWPSSDVPLEAEHVVGSAGKVIQTFVYSQLRYDPNANPSIIKGNIGADWMALTTQVATILTQNTALSGQVSDLISKNATLNGQVSILNGQVSDLQNEVTKLQQQSGAAGQALALLEQLKSLADANAATPPQTPQGGSQ